MAESPLVIRLRLQVEQRQLLAPRGPLLLDLVVPLHLHGLQLYPQLVHLVALLLQLLLETLLFKL